MMPRLERVKTNASIYHIMIRSISEIQLFKERDDKLKYFSLIKKYQLKYNFKIYVYYLLDNKHMYVKYKKKYTHMRVLGCFFMSCFSNIAQKNICKVLGNITESRVSALSSVGVELAFKDRRYSGIVDKFLLEY